MAPFWSRRKETRNLPGEIVRYIPSGPALVVCQECKMAVSLVSAQQVTVRRRGQQDPTNYTDVQEYYCPAHRRAWDIKDLKAGYVTPTYYKHRVEVTEQGQPLYTVPRTELVAAKLETQHVIEGQRILQKSLNESEAEVRDLKASLEATDAENWRLRQELFNLRNKRRRR